MFYLLRNGSLINLDNVAFFEENGNGGIGIYFNFIYGNADSIGTTHIDIDYEEYKDIIMLLNMEKSIINHNQADRVSTLGIS